MASREPLPPSVVCIPACRQGPGARHRGRLAQAGRRRDAQEAARREAGLRPRQRDAGLPCGERAREYLHGCRWPPGCRAPIPVGRPGVCDGLGKTIRPRRSAERHFRPLRWPCVEAPRALSSGPTSPRRAEGARRPRDASVLAPQQGAGTGSEGSSDRWEIRARTSALSNLHEGHRWHNRRLRPISAASSGTIERFVWVTCTRTQTYSSDIERAEAGRPSLHLQELHSHRAVRGVPGQRARLCSPAHRRAGSLVREAPFSGPSPASGQVGRRRRRPGGRMGELLPTFAGTLASEARGAPEVLLGEPFRPTTARAIVRSEMRASSTRIDDASHARTSHRGSSCCFRWSAPVGTRSKTGADLTRPRTSEELRSQPPLSPLVLELVRPAATIRDRPLRVRVEQGIALWSVAPRLSTRDSPSTAACRAASSVGVATQQAELEPDRRVAPGGGSPRAA